MAKEMKMKCKLNEAMNQNERRRRQHRSNVYFILIVLQRVNNTTNEWYPNQKRKCEWTQINVLDKHFNVTPVVVAFQFDEENYSF